MNCQLAMLLGLPRRRYPLGAPRRHEAAGSPTGSAAATTRTIRVSSGRSAISARYCSSMPALTGSVWKDVMSFGVPNSANGFPRASATIRSRIAVSRRRPGNADSSNLRASPSSSPPTARVGNPTVPSIGVGDATAKPTDSACRRRATKNSVWPRRDPATAHHPPGTTPVGPPRRPRAARAPPNPPGTGSARLRFR